MKKNNVKMALCEGRHEIKEAVNGSVFRTEIQDVTNVSALESAALAAIKTAAADIRDLHIDLYVTGLTVALIAALNVCHDNNIAVTLWHFDRVSGNYYPQEVR